MTSLKSRLAGAQNYPPTARFTGKHHPLSWKKLAVVRERARRRGSAAVDDCVQLFVHILRDSGEETPNRIRAAENLADRFGFPRMQSIENIGDAFAVPKLFVTTQFAPPSGFEPEPNGGTDPVAAVTAAGDEDARSS